MKLILDSESDQITYINYLFEANKLFKLFKEITLEDEEITEFLQYVNDKSNTEEEDYCEPIDESRARKRWSSAEKSELLQYVNANISLPEIANRMQRTIESVRKMARSDLDAVYDSKTQSWEDIPF